MENNKELETAFQRCIENYFPLNRFDYDLRGVLWFYENELSPNMRKYFNNRRQTIGNTPKCVRRN